MERKFILSYAQKYFFSTTIDIHIRNKSGSEFMTSCLLHKLNLTCSAYIKKDSEDGSFRVYICICVEKFNFPKYHRLIFYFPAFFRSLARDVRGGKKRFDILNVIVSAGEKKGNHINGFFFIHVDMLHKRSTKENCRSSFHQARAGSR